MEEKNLVIQANQELATLIDEGSELNEKVKMMSARLDEIKAIIRAEAEKEIIESNGTESSVKFLGLKSCVVVVFPESSYQIDQGKIDVLKDIFKDNFDKIFKIEIKVKDKKLLEQILKEGNSAIKSKLNGIITKKANTPKVCF